MTSNGMCNTSQAPPPPASLKQNSIFIMTLNKLNDLKRPENIISTKLMYGKKFKV